jgi:hypothetical protein
MPASPASIALCYPRAWSSNLLQIQAPLIFNPENRENDTLDRNPSNFPLHFATVDRQSPLEYRVWLLITC